MGPPVSFNTRRGNFVWDWFPAKPSVAGRDAAVVLAGVEGGDVVVAVVMLVDEVAFCRSASSLPSRDLVNPPLTGARAVLPHGNSAGGARKEVSRCGTESHRRDI